MQLLDSKNNLEDNGNEGASWTQRYTRPRFFCAINMQTKTRLPACGKKKPVPGVPFLSEAQQGENGTMNFLTGLFWSAELQREGASVPISE